MQVWFTADTHFGHGNIIKYCQRPFMSREETAATRADPPDAAPAGTSVPTSELVFV